MDMSSRINKAGSGAKNAGKALTSGVAGAGRKLGEGARKTKAQVGSATKRAAGTAREKVTSSPLFSPDPATNIAIADVIVRAGGRLLRHTVERTLLGSVYDKEKAKNLIAGRSMGKTLVNTAIARVATRSVPGALIVGGGYLAKALLDRQKGKRAARRDGQAEVNEQAAKGAKDRAEG